MRNSVHCIRFALYVFLLNSFISLAQEVCDNGIDDDGDGYIDLFDDECACLGSKKTRKYLRSFPATLLKKQYAVDML